MSIIVTVVKVFDFIIVVSLLILLFTLDRSRRKSLTPQEFEKFQKRAKDIAERNIAANVAARVIQGGFTVGGFLFAGLFTAVFQPALAPYTTDILIAIGWVLISLITGVMNLAPLAPQSVVNNVAITIWFSSFAIVQFVTIIGAFLRIIVLILQYLKFV